MAKPARKILLLANSASKGAPMFGGGNIRLLEIFKRIFLRDELFFITSEIGRNFFKNGLSRAKYITTPPWFLELSILPGYVLQTLFAVWIMRRRNFDVFYSSSDFFPDVVPAYLFKNRNNRWAQCVFHIYPDWRVRPGNKIVNFVAQQLQLFSFKLIKKRADRIITINQLVRDELVKRGFEASRIHVSGCAIDPRYFHEIKPSKNQKFEGIFLARLNSSKGIFDLVEIWKMVCAEIPGAKLGVIGEGEAHFKEAMEELVRKNGLEKNIVIFGRLENEEAFPILKASKVYLFPSHEEGWGISVAEAMACGLPVVSWNLPVFKEVYEDYTIQVKENDFNAFAEKTIELLKNDKKRLQFGKRGARFVKKYAWGELARKEEQAIMPTIANQ